MIKRNQKLLNLLSSLLDGVLIFLAYLVATYIRWELLPGGRFTLQEEWTLHNLSYIVLYSVLLVVAYHCTQLYGSFRYKPLWQELRMLVWVNVLGTLLVTSGLYLIKSWGWVNTWDISSLVLVMFCAISTLLVSFKRIVVRVVLRYYRRRGYNQKHVIVVGNGHLARQYVESVHRAPHFGFHVDGYVAKEAHEVMGIPRLGNYEDLESLLEGTGIDEVVVALEAHENPFLPVVISACEKQGTKVCIIPFYNDYIPARATLETVGGCKLINIRATPLDNLGAAALKRTVDIAGSLFGLIVLSPLMLATAIGVKLSSPGPIIFKQERVGRYKKPFLMYKFRSMAVNKEQDTAWSTNQDNRKTLFGSIIRKLSIDELPQLVNVLKGEMSLVGPRPEIPHYVELFKESVPLYMVKHQVRPGITGWAQVHGFRGDTSIDGRVQCDIWYIENWSFWLDIRILFMTVFGGMVNKEQLQHGHAHATK